MLRVIAPSLCGEGAREARGRGLFCGVNLPEPPLSPVAYCDLSLPKTPSEETPPMAMIHIKVPSLGESITEATVAAWRVAAGEAVAEGDILVELETDKVMVEVPATASGVLASIAAPEGTVVGVDGLLGQLNAGIQGKAASPQPPGKQKETAEGKTGGQPAALAEAHPSPAVRHLVAEHKLDLTQIPASGKGGRHTRGDIVNFMDQHQPHPASGGQPTPSAGQPPGGSAATSPASSSPPVARPPLAPEEGDRREPMSPLRRRIAERLKSAQNTAAILTTFNEVDMSAVMALRSRYKDSFKEKYGISLGFMSFFTKAAVEALKAYPAVNAQIDGTDIVYKNHYDIGVAVGTDRGLVVPVVRGADRLKFIEIETAIAALAKKARDGKLSLEDLSGGTFSISNGGVYGSMLSTPILNPPQSAILGLHNIVKRPVVVEDTVGIRPVMYLAVSYDHRIIDGSEAVRFLVKIKEAIEDPARLLLEI